MHELDSQDTCGTSGGGQSYISENTPQQLNQRLNINGLRINGLDTWMNVILVATTQFN
jgi:hypothetical protein